MFRKSSAGDMPISRGVYPMSVLTLAFIRKPVHWLSRNPVTVRARSMADYHRFFHLWLVKSPNRRSNATFNL
jgi:hypothetical protein